MTDAAAIVLAAGSGARLGADLPKAFVPLGARPLLAHAVDTLRACPRIGAIVVAVPAAWVARATALLGADAGCAVVAGGETRRDSVRVALDALPADTGVVVCHDAARPLAPPALVDAVLDALADADGAVPGLPVVDTVKRVEGGLVVRTEPRAGLVAVQTPQAFRVPALREAHRRLAAADGAAVTDDAMAVEAVGGRIRVVPGDPRAFKVTDAADLARAEALLAGVRVP
ncbi:MAG: 2-C-methyl-D-erythritol 4-phosphate cytidylyltransferase [Actinomycetota bacterium]